MRIKVLLALQQSGLNKHDCESIARHLPPMCGLPTVYQKMYNKEYLACLKLFQEKRCPFCLQAYSNRNKYLMCVQSHSEMATYRCAECGLFFKYVTALQKHANYGTSQRSARNVFVYCRFCKIEVHRSGFVAHVRDHHRHLLCFLLPYPRKHLKAHLKHTVCL